VGEGEGAWQMLDAVSRELTMAFEKEPRYVVTRIHEDSGRRVYMNDIGDETSIPSTFGATWSCGEPGMWTFHQATKRCSESNEARGAIIPRATWMFAVRECFWTVQMYDPKASWN